MIDLDRLKVTLRQNVATILAHQRSLEHSKLAAEDLKDVIDEVIAACEGAFCAPGGKWASGQELPSPAVATSSSEPAEDEE